MRLYYHKIAKYRVSFSLLFVIMYIFISRPAFQFLPFALSLIMIGEALRLWASGYLRKGVKLANSGPYAFVRHPLYIGNFFLGLGFILLAWNLLLLFIFISFFIFFYFCTIKAEDEELLKSFGQEYLDYKKQVPLILPRLRSFKGEKEKYNWALIRKNREHKTIIGLVLIFAIQLLKTYFL